MKTNLRHYLTGSLLLAIVVLFSACKKNNNPPQLSTTPLYDTLGWFIQGAMGPVEGNGTKMIADPDMPGMKIQAGRLAIRTVVNTALPIIAADPQLAPYFPTLIAELGAGNKTGYADLLESFSSFVQQGVSGQKVYKGKSMKVVHNNATYKRFGSATDPTSDNDDFDKFIGDIVVAAQSLKVPGSVINQLGVILNSVRGDVVQK